MNKGIGEWQDEWQNMKLQRDAEKEKVRELTKVTAETADRLAGVKGGSVSSTIAMLHAAMKEQTP